MDKKPTSGELLKIVYQKFGVEARFDKYEDHDGDKVTIENDDDLDEAFNIYYSLKASRPQLLHTLKLFLQSSQSSSPPVPHHNPSTSTPTNNNNSIEKQLSNESGGIPNPTPTLIVSNANPNSSTDKDGAFYPFSKKFYFFNLFTPLFFFYNFFL